MNAPLQNITTNIITGFLGVDKTTVILNSLKSKPEHERWSVLVNEAGKIGVDGKVTEHSGIAVKQVPGVFMCCAAGLPMQVAVNRLLIETRPHRLLIETSAMGHPRNILKTLAAREHDGVLDVRPAEEFAAGHIPDAINIQLSDLEKHLDTFEPDQEIVA